jgi:hypothetical protein
VITVLTLCATNYLAHAKSLGDSLATLNPDYLVIGLVDRLPPDIPPSFNSLLRPKLVRPAPRRQLCG